MSKNQLNMKKIIYTTLFSLFLLNVTYAQDFYTYYYRGINPEDVRKANIGNTGYPIKSSPVDHTGVVVVSNNGFVVLNDGTMAQGTPSTSVVNGASVLTITFTDAIILISSNNLFCMISNGESLMYNIYKVEAGYYDSSQPSNNSNYNYSTPTSTSTYQSTCTYCNGSGKRCKYGTVSTYGVSGEGHRCKDCGEWLNHGEYHALVRCTMCNGTGVR